MKIQRYLLALVFLVTCMLHGQRSKIYTNELVDYDHAVELYQNKDYAAAQKLFEEIKDDFDDASELKAHSYYYEAFCAIRLGDRDGEDMMNEFFEKFPTSTKRNSAFLEVGDYYFNDRKYAYALKWYSKVNSSGLTLYSQEDFNFKMGYSLFAVGSFASAKKYFSPLLDSEKYGAQAKYYYGYMAYQDDDFSEADKYLSQVATENAYDEEIAYYMVNIRFKTGKFQEAIDAGLPLLEKSNGLQRSELSKIMGECYFNLGEYDRAIPYLQEYEGKKGKWNNTDFYQLGYAYYMQQDYENAMLWFTKIIDGDNAVSQNAYYHLAECYLKSDKKQEALNAFRNAKDMDFDPSIKQDAWLNYVKLSYEIGNPYNSTAVVIQEYLQAYPDGPERDEIRELLISAYLTSNDYQGALDYLTGNNSDDDDTYQKVALLYGLQLFREEKFEDAVKYLDLAASKGSNEAIGAKAQFWKAESFYRLEDYYKALSGFEAFRSAGEPTEVPERALIDYHVGYTYFQLQDYSKAGGHFNEFVDVSNNNDLLTDSYLRLGDCFFALSNYYKAVPFYEKVIEANGNDVDYAQLQIAYCHGFMGDTEKKIENLLEFTQTNLKSTLRDDAFYELGNSYVKINRNEEALEAYDQVVQNYRMSSLVPKSLLKQGLVYFNTDRNEEALVKYKAVIERFPGTDESREAVANAKQIYVAQGRVDAYEAFVKNIDFVSVTDEEIDNAMYASAEQFYLANDPEKAIPALEKYLERFPSGSNALNANFYLAEAYRNTGQKDKAMARYQVLLDKENNAYTERALVQTAQYYLEEEQTEKAMEILTRLEAQAESEPNLLFAESNLMKAYYETREYENAVAYAEKVLQKGKLENRVRSDAEIIIARSAFETGDFIKAQEGFEKLRENASGEVKAEAIYYDAFFKNEEGNYKLSNVSIQELASDFSMYRYWGGKGLIIMAKNFYALEDAYQATYILESVIQKFSEFEDVVKEARLELDKIKKEQSKTNSSVILEEN